MLKVKLGLNQRKVWLKHPHHISLRRLSYNSMYKTSLDNSYDVCSKLPSHFITDGWKYQWSRLSLSLSLSLPHTNTHTHTLSSCLCIYRYLSVYIYVTFHFHEV